jgi:transposase InsO family protein
MEFPIEKMCKVLGVSRSSYYEHQRFIDSPRHAENRSLLAIIQQIHQKCKARYGSPRITAELRAMGYKVSRPRVARLMKTAGIRAVHARKFVVTTDSKHNFAAADNVLDRSFAASRPAEKWVSDITYVRTGTGWLYVTVILDLYDRKVVGWSMSNNMTAKDTSIAAWRMAVNNRPPGDGLIFHSDRGVQYACNEYSQLLKNRNVIRSMSRKGNCWDNAVAESFFKTLKVELVYQCRFINHQAAEIQLFAWIEGWYNRNRRHSALGNMTIQEFNEINRLTSVA